MYLKRLLALLCSLALVFCLLPSTAFAEGGNGNIDGGIYALGPAMGLIRDIKTVQELMDGMVDEAEAVINGLRSGIC